jgi:hypothetical protein
LDPPEVKKYAVASDVRLVSRVKKQNCVVVTDSDATGESWEYDCYFWRNIVNLDHLTQARNNLDDPRAGPPVFAPPRYSGIFRLVVGVHRRPRRILGPAMRAIGGCGRASA